jgi:hypothetical protein
MNPSCVTDIDMVIGTFYDANIGGHLEYKGTRAYVGFTAIRTKFEKVSIFVCYTK